MKASVLDDGGYDQNVGEDDDKADDHAQGDDGVVTLAPVIADVLPTGLVEELDSAVEVASLRVLRHCVHVAAFLSGRDQDAEKTRESSRSRAPFRRAVSAEIRSPSAAPVPLGCFQPGQT